MKKSIQHLFFLSIIALFLIEIACTPKIKPDPDPVVAADCIDQSKIDEDRACPKNYVPVCGCDGKTYGNQCEAQKAGLTKWTDGPCAKDSVECIDKTKISLRPCPSKYDPVCGCDGKTYDNECSAEVAGVTKWTKGACETTSCIDSTKIDPNRGCPRNYDPVCGCDKKTYSNECNAEIAGVTRWVKGKCEDCYEPNPKKKPCTKEYKPVCGCDGKTYSNPCEAENAGIKKWQDGACLDKCIDESKIDPDGVCPMIYAPVCGCDGKTYGNSCQAEKAGVTSWVEGKCN